MTSTILTFPGIRSSGPQASAWGSRFIDICALGHINASSGLGQWHDGYALLQQLCD